MSKSAQLRQLLIQPGILVLPGVEDQMWPKKCGHFSGKKVIPAEEQIEKLKAAVQARGESKFLLIARTDAAANFGLSEAIRRGEAYLEAGADMLFIEAPQSLSDLQAIAEAFPNTLFKC